MAWNVLDGQVEPSHAARGHFGSHGLDPEFAQLLGGHQGDHSVRAPAANRVEIKRKVPRPRSGLGGRLIFARTEGYADDTRASWDFGNLQGVGLARAQRLLLAMMNLALTLAVAPSSSQGDISMDWFEKLTGFREGGYAETQGRLRVEGERLTSTVNGCSYDVGRLEISSLAELREQAAGRLGSGRLTVANLIGDVRALHHDPANRGSLFQVASQFNLLEMISPSVTPEDGVTRYADDHTQGPACAIAAGAGTIWRNYLVPLGGQAGQTATCQIDGAADLRAALAQALGVPADDLWRMRNGYALPTASSLALIGDYLSAIDDDARGTLKGTLRIGVHCGVEVTDGPTPGHTVTQAFCSAMPVSYSSLDPAAWAPLARLVLEAAYEATLAAALLRDGEAGSAPVFLTRLGGGAFGNDGSWIDDAIRLALARYRDAALDVRFVSYGSAPTSMREIEADFNGSASR